MSAVNPKGRPTFPVNPEGRPVSPVNPDPESAPPIENDNAQYTFYDYHRPTLLNGDYELTVAQTVTIPGQSVPAPYSPASKIIFTVGAEKYSLKPDDIHSVFPPEGSLGAYEDCLPHIVLKRSTLPWEYSALSSKAPNREQFPWIALLLFHEDDRNQNRYSLSPPAQATKPEQQGQPIDSAQHIEIKDSSLLQTILPKANELPLLCHVRAQSQSSSHLQESLAVVIGNRKPKHGRNTVHLISLESRYPNSSFDGRATFITLKSWDFYCDQNLSEQHESLDRLFQKIQPVLLRYPDPENASADLQKFLSQGMVALPHHLRTGETTVSWYRGPLIPGKPSTTALAAIPILNTADALLRYHPDLSMLDVSYAAAWELGRLLTLQNKAIATALQQWRFQEECRAHCQAMAHTDSDCCHLPAVQRRAQTAEESQIPPALTQWIDDLRHLKSIPFRYLVPDDRMLPTEAIAFFYVDPCWIDHLLSGVFSLIDQPTNHAQHCQQAVLELLGSSPRQELITGFLMRSAAVAGWSGLIVEGRSETDALLNTYVHAQLSPNVLMHLFKGEVKQITLEQKPETLHFDASRIDARQDESSMIDLSKETPHAAELARKLSHQIQVLKMRVMPKPSV